MGDFSESLFYLGRCYHSRVSVKCLVFAEPSCPDAQASLEALGNILTGYRITYTLGVFFKKKLFLKKTSLTKNLIFFFIFLFFFYFFFIFS